MPHRDLRPLQNGATITPSGVSFRIWAPEPSRVELQMGDGRTFPMSRTGDHWTATVEGAAAGLRYGYRLDGAGPFPNPWSRAQPDGVHALSQVVDPAAFTWTDATWTSPAREDLAIYELHPGTFTSEGTFDAAAGHLPYLRDLGINAVELLPVAAFPGERGWGYDGVSYFAPHHTYGGPEGLRRFVDAAHATGLAVILDVVYNHFGPDGNYLPLYTNTLYTDIHHTPWGAAVNYDGPGSTGVREFVLENIRYWLREFHIDGFRFDATAAIIDVSRRHILQDAAEAAGEPQPYLIAETSENDTRYFRPRNAGGLGFDGVWADDFHHSVHRLLTAETDGYYASYEGTTTELARIITQGFLYEGQVDPFAGKPRGTNARHVEWRRFVACLQNHDQVGNRALGQRLTSLASPGNLRAATALLLLLPHTPLLIQGQEFGATTPFLYFTDHEPELGRLVTAGRRREFAAFAAFAGHTDDIPDPQARSTFTASILSWDEASSPSGVAALRLHRDLLALRTSDPALIAMRRGRPPIEAWTGDTTIVIHLQSPAGSRLLAANFGPAPATIALPSGGPWTVTLTTDDPRYGGTSAAVPPALVSTLPLAPGSAAFLEPAR